MPGHRERAFYVEARLDRTGLPCLVTIELEPVDPAHLTVEGQETLARDLARPSHYPSFDLALDPHARPRRIHCFERGVQAIRGNDVVSAQSPRGRVDDPPTPGGLDRRGR